MRELIRAYTYLWTNRSTYQRDCAGLAVAVLAFVAWCAWLLAW